MTTFVCLYRHYYGIGESPEVAQKNARKAGGRGTVWAIKQLPEGSSNVSVDDYGSIHWKGPDGPCNIVKHGKGLKVRDE